MLVWFASVLCVSQRFVEVGDYVFNGEVGSKSKMLHHYKVVSFLYCFKINVLHELDVAVFSHSCYVSQSYITNDQWLLNAVSRHLYTPVTDASPPPPRV